MADDREKVREAMREMLLQRQPAQMSTTTAPPSPRRNLNQRQDVRDGMRNILVSNYSQYVAPNQPVEEEDKSFLDRAQGTLGSVLGTAGTVLDYPREQISEPILGAVSKGISHLGPLNTMSEEKEQAIQDADSYTEAYNINMADKAGWQNFAVEAASDPLNLVGIGAVSKLRHAGRARNLIEAGGRGDKALGTVQTLDEKAAQLFALPVTAGVGIIRNTAGRTKAGQWFANSARGLYYSGLRRASQTFRRLGEEEASLGAADAVLRDESRQIAGRLYQTAPDGYSLQFQPNAVTEVDNLSDYQLLRQVRENLPLYQASPEMVQKLQQRDIFGQSGGITIPARTHAEIDEALRNVGIDVFERDTLHLLVDFMAEALPQNQTWSGTVFTSPEAVLDRIKFHNVDGPTVFNRDGSIIRVGVGSDATTEKIAEGLFENFLAPSMSVENRARFLAGSGVTTPGSPVPTNPFDGLGSRVVQMIRQTDVTTDAELQDLFNRFRGVLRLTPPGEGLPNAAAETVLDNLSQQQMGTRVNRFPPTQQGPPQPAPQGSQTPSPQQYTQTGMPTPATQQRLPTTPSAAPQTPTPPPPRQMGLDEQPPNFQQTQMQLPLQQQLPLGQTSPLNMPPPQGQRVPTPPAGTLWQGPPAPNTRRQTIPEANANPTPQGFQRRFGPEAPGNQTPLTQLAPDATFDEYVTRLADTHNMQPQQFEPVRQQLKPVIEKNPDYFQSGALVGNETFEKHLIAATNNPQNANFHLSEAMDAINLQMAATHFRNPLVSRLFRLPGVPDMKRRGPATRFGKTTDTQLRADREEAARVLGDANVQKELKEWSKFATIVENGLDRIRQDVPLAPVLDTTSFRQALTDKRITKHFTPDELDALHKAIDALGGTRGSAAREAAYHSRIMEAWDKSLRKDLKIPPLKRNAVTREMDRATRAWREQALVSVRYFAANALDMAVKSAVMGIGGLNPIGLRNAGQQQAIRWGLFELPESLKTGRLQELSYQSGQLEPQRLGRSSAIGEYIGAVSETGQGYADRFINWNRGIAIAMEDSARTAAWIHGTREFLEKSFHQRFLNYTSRRARDMGLSEAQTQAMVRELRTQGVDYGPDDVQKWVLNNGGSQELATDIGNTWARGIQEGSLHGEDLANRVHFQIGDERNIEAALRLRHVLPFHTWATRNIPFYLQTLAANPWIYRTINHYNEATEEEGLALGLTARFENKMLIPKQLNGLASIFLGPGYHAYNPMVAFSLMDQFKGGYEPDMEDSTMPFLGEALNKAGNLGFRPAPWFDLPLNVIGVYGTQEPFGVWRQGDVVAGTVEAATGINVDFKPTVQAVTALRNLNPNVPDVDTVSNSQFTDRSINLRLREMAFEATGDAEHPVYIAASLDPNSELYKEARKDVVRRGLRRSIQGFVNPMPYTTATPQEVEAMAAMPDTGGQPLPSEMASSMRRWEHPATRFWSIPDNAVESQINAGFNLQDKVPESLQDAVLADEGLQYFYDYLAWLQTLPQGRDRSIRAFMQQRRN